MEKYLSQGLVFSFDFLGIFRSSFFTKHLRAIVSEEP